MKNILICGSLAYDSIMVFQDYFKNHILPDQIHKLSVSFYVPELRRNFGGTAGNIAYNLSLLKSPSIIWPLLVTIFSLTPTDSAVWKLFKTTLDLLQTH